MLFSWGFHKKSPNFVHQELKIASSNDIMQILGLVELQIYHQNHSFWPGVLIFFSAAIDCILVLLTHFCLLVIQEPENWCFLALFMVNFKEVYVVSSSKVSSSKSVKIFHWIFGITLSQGHSLSRVHNFVPICENTMF